MRDDDVVAATLAFPLERGGSIPTSSLQIKSMRLMPCEWPLVAKIFSDFHYRKKAIGGSLRYCFALMTPDCDVVGGAAFGDPRHREKWGGIHRVLELRRFALVDDAPKNSESFFIGRCLWWLKKHTATETVISYADPAQGHDGTIYRASGFSLEGESGAGSVVLWKGREYHARSLTIDRPYSVELRQAVANGEATIRRTPGKFLYVRRLREAA